jgi:hypothetical protein
MTTMMMKMMTPTASEPPVTKFEKAITTCPAAAAAWSGSGTRSGAVRIRRVVAALSTSRKSVVPSNSEGKTENSRGLPTKMVVTSTTAEIVRLMISRKSRTAGGSGTRMTITSATHAIGRIIPRLRWTAAKIGLVARAAAMIYAVCLLFTLPVSSYT